MLKILLVILLSSFMFGQTTWSEEPENRYEHIVLHTGISAFSSALATEYGMSQMQSWWIGFGVSAAIGIGKELSDTNFDWNDVGANTIGGAIGSTGMWTIYKFQSGK